jgi:hypothetical protein
MLIFEMLYVFCIVHGKRVDWLVLFAKSGLLKQRRVKMSVIPQGLNECVCR